MPRDLAKQAQDLEQLATELRNEQHGFRKAVGDALEQKRRALDDQLEGPLSRLGKIAEKR